MEAYRLAGIKELEAAEEVEGKHLLVEEHL